jgi:hypothetical protein
MYLRKISFIWLFFVLFAATFASAFAAAKCKQSDLLACLDSVCSEDMEPTSRCYLCGTSAAKKPKAADYALGDSPVMQSLSVGKSSKNTISDKELKSAPKDPGERYQWATKECAKKIKDCEPEDVSDNYDKLIDQACKVALNDTEYEASLKKAAVKKTAEQCASDLNACLLASNKCDGNMLKCETDEEFNRNFSACMVLATGCDEFTTTLRDRMKKSRDEMVAKKDGNLDDLVSLKKMERERDMKTAKNLCSGAGKEMCVAEVCGNFPNGLDANGLCADPEEKILAANLCKFVDIACNKLK